jgi:hypothetical protein
MLFFIVCADKLPGVVHRVSFFFRRTFPKAQNIVRFHRRLVQKDMRPRKQIQSTKARPVFISILAIALMFSQAIAAAKPPAVANDTIDRV